MEKQSFDLVVIGTGSGASTAAGKCASTGWNVAQIDDMPFGGTCALRGCDPKKVLVGAADLVDWNLRMNSHGIRSNAAIDWKDLMKYKRSFTDPVPSSREEGMKKAGITPIHGLARFINESTIQVEDYQLTGKHILIASGAKPVPLPIDGSEYLANSTDFLGLDKLPGKLVFVGGGYISFEFAFVSALAGSEVHIVHRGVRPLEGFDADMVNILIEKTKELGITIHLEAEVESVAKDGNGYVVTASQNGVTKKHRGDLVVHGAGRIPNIDGMNLPKGNVTSEKGGVTVNEYLQSVSNPRVYAAGDAAATDGKPLTPVAGYESQIVASNLLDGNYRKAEYPAQPTVVFTIPPLASVGLTQQQAEDQGIDIEVHTNKMNSWYSYRRINESHAAYKTITEKGTGRIIGAHLLGTKTGEIINLFTMAMNHGLTSDDLKKMIYAYPTHSSDIPYMV